MTGPDIESDRHLDAEHWTPRQREVFELIAAGKTNAEIAAALNLSLEGAKWHVREIMAKLGVSSREEAAEYWRVRNGLRPRFSRPLRGLSGLGVVRWGAAVMTAGTAVLAVVVAIALLTNDDEPPASTGADPATPMEFLERVQQALAASGEVVYIEVRTEVREGGAMGLAWTAEAWFDVAANTSRLHWVLGPEITADVAQERTELATGDHLYYVDDSSRPPVKRYLWSDVSSCFEGSATLVVMPLLCGFAPGRLEEHDLEIEGIVEFEGRKVRSLALRDARSRDGQDFGTNRLFVDVDTYLPVAHTLTAESAPDWMLRTTYRVEGMTRDSLDPEFFDPVGFGYLIPEEEDLRVMDEVGSVLPLYWPGRRYTDKAGRRFELVEVQDRRPPGLGGAPRHLLTLSYRGQDGSFRLDYWQPGDWEMFVDALGTGFQWAQCSERRSIAIPLGEVVILRGFELPERPPGNVQTPVAGASPAPAVAPNLFPDGCPSRPFDRFMAELHFPRGTVTINAPYGWGPDPGDRLGQFDTEEGLEALARSLVLRQAGE